MAEKSIKTRIQMKRGTSAEWALATGFKPLEGEHIFYIDLNKEKVGRYVDGTTDEQKKSANHTDYLMLLSELDFLAAGDADTLDGKHASEFALKADVPTSFAPLDAEKNQNAFSKVAVSGQANVEADIVTDTLTLVAGNNITITTNATNDSITINAKDTTYSNATDGASGLMSGSDKAKLDAIEIGANKTTVDSALNNTSTNPVQNKVINAALSSKLDTTLKGAANGLAELDANGKVPTAQLPSYVDDVLEYAKKDSFPATGESGKIYVDTSTNITWRWSGSTYVEISPSIALGETSETAYRGDRGKIAYDHSQTAHAPANAQKNSDITKAEIEAKLTGTITSHTHNYTSLISSGTADPSTSTTSQYYFKYN